MEVASFSKSSAAKNFKKNKIYIFRKPGSIDLFEPIFQRQVIAPAKMPTNPNKLHLQLSAAHNVQRKRVRQKINLTRLIMENATLLIPLKIIKLGSFLTKHPLKWQNNTN